MNDDEHKKVKGTKRKAKEEIKKEKKPNPPKKADSKKKTKDKQIKDTPAKKEKKTSARQPKAENAKDENIPKRAWPAFFFFQQEKRPELKKEFPAMSQKELVAVSTRPQLEDSALYLDIQNHVVNLWQINEITSYFENSP